jgi:glycerol-3-phosphate dehydrogenase (NAD(P)+)
LAKVGVIGAGGWGTALAKLLTSNGHDVMLWSREAETAAEINQAHQNTNFLKGISLPENLKASTDMNEVVKDRLYIVMAVPSQWVRHVAKTLSTLINPQALVINAAKGLELTTQKRLTQVLTEELALPDHRIVALSGPNHAEEVGLSLPSASVVASPNLECAEEAQDLLMNHYFRVYTNPDRIGVELGGAIKNIISLAAGISEGLGFGDNTKAAIITRGIAEMARLGMALGAKSDTFAGLSGLGDLFVTASSKHSRNRWAGQEIGSGRSPNDVLASTLMVVEGVPTTKAAYLLAKKANVEMPITNKVYEILFEGASPRQCVGELMGRGRTHESEEVVRVIHTM